MEGGFATHLIEGSRDGVVVGLHGVDLAAQLAVELRDLIAPPDPLAGVRGGVRRRVADLNSEGGGVSRGIIQ